MLMLRNCLLRLPGLSLQGYQRTLVLEGCLNNFIFGLHSQPDLRYIDRDAVAVLLEEGGSNGGSYGHPLRVLLLDVRRSDERALYGAIKGSVHIPCEQCSDQQAPPMHMLEGMLSWL